MPKITGKKQNTSLALKNVLTDVYVKFCGDFRSASNSICL